MAYLAKNHSQVWTRRKKHLVRRIDSSIVPKSPKSVGYPEREFYSPWTQRPFYRTAICAPARFSTSSLAQSPPPLSPPPPLLDQRLHGNHGCENDSAPTLEINRQSRHHCPLDNHGTHSLCSLYRTRFNLYPFARYSPKRRRGRRGRTFQPAVNITMTKNTAVAVASARDRYIGGPLRLAVALTFSGSVVRPLHPRCCDGF